ncbi:hypothetical protein ACFWVT_12700 [Streptomyces cyaneofuscatus]|uniref:hypothetical protein n=1 Tax=Streptomyces cyaneofuscatus TaxID=66883 RepID=UPI003667BA6E
MSRVPDAVDDQERRAARREVLLLEYEVLKAEQKARIIARDHLMYATLAGLVSVLVVVFTAEAPAGTVLLLPPVDLVMFVVPTVVAVVLHWTAATPGRGLSLVAAAELAAAAVLAVRIVLAAGFASERRTP